MPIHDAGDYTQGQLQESTERRLFEYIRGTGAADSVSVKGAPLNTLGASILDFAQFPKRIQKRKRREKGKGESFEWLSQSYLVSTPAYDYFNETNRKNLDCTGFRLLTQLSCPCLSAKLIEAPEKNLAWRHQRASQPEQWKISRSPAQALSSAPLSCLPAHLLSAFMPPSKYSVDSVCLFSTSRHPRVQSYSSPGQISFSLTSRCANRHSTARPRRRRPGGRPGHSWRWWWWGWGPGSSARCPASWRCSHRLLPCLGSLVCSLGRKTKLAPWVLLTHQMTVDSKMDKKLSTHLVLGCPSQDSPWGISVVGFGSSIAKKHQCLCLRVVGNQRVGGKVLGLWCCDFDRKLSTWKPLFLGKPWGLGSNLIQILCSPPSMRL